MSDIAKRAGTTVGVVSVTLNGAQSKTLRVSAATKERVLLAAAELGYRRDPRAGALATGRNNVIGLMQPFVESYTVPDPFCSMIATGVASVAAREGYNLMLYTAVAEEEGERAAKSIDRRIDGLILVIPPETSPIYEECKRLGIPVVGVTADISLIPAVVNSDEYVGGQLATQHLINLGHRRIAHLKGSSKVYTSEIRYRAYMETLRAAGIEPDPGLVLNGNFQRNTSYVATQKLMKLPPSQRPTAIFAANDPSAHGALDAVLEVGLRVPEDVSIVGYDDTWYASIPSPSLTSVNMSVEMIGRRAAEILLHTIEDPSTADEFAQNHPILPVSLTIRQSTGPAPTYSS